MTKKAKHRLLGALIVILGVLAIGLVAVPLLKEQEKQQQQTREDKKLDEFLAWRDE